MLLNRRILLSGCNTINPRLHFHIVIKTDPINILAPYVFKEHCKKCNIGNIKYMVTSEQHFTSKYKLHKMQILEILHYLYQSASQRIIQRNLIYSCTHV